MMRTNLPPSLVPRSLGPRSVVLLAVLAAAASALTMSGCSRSRAAGPGGPPPVPAVSVALPEKSMVQDSMEYTARIEPSQRVEVRSRVSGYLQQINFRDGQQVKEGDPLFVIDPRPFAAARDRAQAGLTQAGAREKLASALYGRSSTLQKSGAASTEELERARGELESARAAMQVSRAELRSAELELSFASIRAPIAGIVSDRRVDVGNYVAGGAAQGGVLTTIVTHSPVRAMVDLSEADFQRLRAQRALPTKVELTLGGEHPRQGATVDFIDNEIGGQSGTVRLRASLANAKGEFMPGSFARVHIPVGAPQERLLVPDAAILNDQNKKMVFVVDANSQVAPRKLALGGLVGGKHVVLSGLAPQERVIVAGAAKVRPGDRVTVVQPAKGI